MKYKLVHDRFEYEAGITVYDCVQHDYGCARDDTRYTGVLHISVTTNENGGYPFFTVPITSLESL